MDWKVLCLLFFVVVIITAEKEVSEDKLITINDDNWSAVLEGEWMLEFYAPWCPACKSLASKWKDFANNWSEKLDIHVGHTDVTSNPGLSGRFLITAFPTIYHIKDGAFRKYTGIRSKEELVQFVEQKKWKNVDPLPWWRSPASVHMTVVSSFFKLALIVRQYQDHIIQKFGIPEWSSYILFALGVIVFGTTIGIVCVCILDFMFRPKLPLPAYTVPDQKEEEKKDSLNDSKEEKEEDDVLKDESNAPENQELRKRKGEPTETK